MLYSLSVTHKDPALRTKIMRRKLIQRVHTSQRVTASDTLQFALGRIHGRPITRTDRHAYTSSADHAKSF